MTSCSLSFAAPCASGLEKLTAAELSLEDRSTIASRPGLVLWQGTIESAYRMCLWSRYASRILLQIGTFSVGNNDELYMAAGKVDWLSHMVSTTTFAVSVTLGANSPIDHSHYAALRVKDAIADFFRQKNHARPSVEKKRPDVKIHVYLENSEATLYVDLSGDSLHRRGYRKVTGVAPMKETLAAAMVALSGWDSSIPASESLVDPMCGSATLLIEAALLYGDSAPGLCRKYFGFSGWLGHDEKLWSSLVEEALERKEQGLARKWPLLLGYDCDESAVAAARKNIESAGLTGRIVVQKKELAHLKNPTEKGVILCNLPYGERLAEKSEIRYLYSALDYRLRKYFTGWRTGFFLADPDAADTFSGSTQEHIKLYNGPLPCRLLTGRVGLEESVAYQRKESDQKEMYSESERELANRLKKNSKKVVRWAKQNDITCFRLYDRDIPEYNVTIDCYENWFLIQEYMPPSDIDEGLAQKRFSTVISVVQKFFSISRRNIFTRRRSKQRGKEQYRKKEQKPVLKVIREKNCRFLVNFSNYLDTGLFLDHRVLRLELGQIAKKKKFLNLFGYTGTATVHAAMGGALKTTTVDLSSRYIEWTKKNLSLNGLCHHRNELVEADCLTWLKEGGEKYDIIFMDPPTFSNTKKSGRVFDVQKQHALLIELAMERLEDDGLLFFSTNYKKFKLDPSIESTFAIAQRTDQTTPFDFPRKPAPHHCWAMKNKRQ